MIVPIFIPIHHKSDKELREEMAREAKWRKAVEEEERIRKEQEHQRELEKIREKEKRLKELNDEYERNRKKDPWQYQFLPEGWSLLGQTHIEVITEV